MFSELPRCVLNFSYFHAVYRDVINLYNVCTYLPTYLLFVLKLSPGMRYQHYRKMSDGCGLTGNIIVFGYFLKLDFTQD